MCSRMEHARIPSPAPRAACARLGGAGTGRGRPGRRGSPVGTRGQGRRHRLLPGGAGGGGAAWACGSARRRRGARIRCAACTIRRSTPGPSSRCSPRSTRRCPAGIRCVPAPQPSAPADRPATTAASGRRPYRARHRRRARGLRRPDRRRRRAVRGRTRRAGLARAATRSRIVPSEATGDFLAPLPVGLSASPSWSRCFPGSASAPSASSPRSISTTWPPASARWAPGCTPSPGGAIPARRPRASRRATSTPSSTSNPPSSASTRSPSGCASPPTTSSGLLADHLVCTAVRVELHGDREELDERVWLHPRSFSAAEVVDRVRWQLQAADDPRAPPSCGCG